MKEKTLGRIKGNKNRQYDNMVMIINNLSVMGAIKIGSKSIKAIKFSGKKKAMKKIGNINKRQRGNKTLWLDKVTKIKQYNNTGIPNNF